MSVTLKWVTNINSNMEGLTTFDVTSFSVVFHSYQDDGKVIMKGCVHWARGYKTFFMLNSVENEILNAHKYNNIKKFSLYSAQISLECYFPAHKC